MTIEEDHINLILNTHSGFSPPDFGAELSREEFLEIQARFFDRESRWYATNGAKPNFTEPRLREIAVRPKAYISKAESQVPNILDVGTGTGVLIGYIREVFPCACIHAIDVSPEQLVIAKSNHPNVAFYEGDISSFVSPKKYDVIYCNACFGNFLDQASALYNMSTMLSESGLIVISHPLGSAFVEGLRQANRTIVPNTLPADVGQVGALIRHANLALVELLDEQGLYICILRYEVSALR